MPRIAEESRLVAGGVDTHTAPSKFLARQGIATSPGQLRAVEDRHDPHVRS